MRAILVVLSLRVKKKVPTNWWCIGAIYLHFFMGFYSHFRHLLFALTDQRQKKIVDPNLLSQPKMQRYARLPFPGRI